MEGLFGGGCVGKASDVRSWQSPTGVELLSGRMVDCDWIWQHCEAFKFLSASSVRPLSRDGSENYSRLL